ncbi:MAG: hypothetical protein HC836_05550 [Richelia sp. RM2_1_2]|nr:hypothetical protein [Richelia sp. SM2_1_7]NJM20719.1 hypothetical protein [Richelia sp. SM1_7_0]NJN07152.1 hypothetical protein [Richelia sp. RM1_1_1]NJO31220.1 hypothetical protein [Richelia sp. SL_2_1]NJO57843.1 hypothetical protein [Richelia sp. RM2_1_2]
MQKPETLAELICRTVLEFEQRQAAELQHQNLLENASTPLSKKKSTTIKKSGFLA